MIKLLLNYSGYANRGQVYLNQVVIYVDDHGLLLHFSLGCQARADILELYVIKLITILE